MKTEFLRWYKWSLLLGLTGFVVYARGIGIDYYADDYQFVFDLSPHGVLYSFFHDNPHNSFYRPIQAAFLTIIQACFGLNTIPIHLTQIIMHVMLSLLVAIAVIKLGFSRIQAALGAIFMLVSQANVHAVLSNDTFSQIGGTLFGCFSLWLLYLTYQSYGLSNTDSQIIKRKGYYLSIVMLTVSYFSKETSISFFPMLLGIIILANLRRHSCIFRKILIQISPIILVTFFYLLVRSFVVTRQPAFGSSIYNFHLGINIIHNLGMFFFAATVPISSVTTYLALNSGNISTFLIVLVATVFVVSLIVSGLWFSRKHSRIIFSLGAFAIFGLFPTFMLNHVSELYVYTSMPFISAIIGIGLGKFLKSSKTHRITYITILSIISLLFLSHYLSIQTKAMLMKERGERSSMILSQIEPYVEKVPENGKLLLVNQPSNEIEYSVFIMRGFNVLRNGLHRINEISGRYDFTTYIVDRPEIAVNHSVSNQCCLSLTLSIDGKVVQVD